MNPNAASSGLSDLAGLVLAGSAIYIVLVLGIAFIAAYINYRIIKAAVRDGVVEAMRRTGNSDGQGIIQGYPPVQSYGAPVPPYRES